MKHASKLATISLAVLGGAVLLTGCKASKCIGPDGGEVDNCVTLEPLKRYNGTPETKSAAWTAGKNVTINNGNGSITVNTASTTSDVVVTGAPFAMEAANDQGRQSAISIMQNQLQLVVQPDASGNIGVTGNGTGNHGYEMTVSLPSAFNGALAVTGNSGSVSVATVPTSPSTVVSTSAGDITVSGAAGHLEITGKASDITASANPTGPANFIKTDVGDITATIPATADLAIQAVCESGTVKLAPSMTNATMAPDNMSAGITLGNGTGKLDVQSGMGDIIFQ